MGKISIKKYFKKFYILQNDFFNLLNFFNENYKYAYKKTFNYNAKPKKSKYNYKDYRKIFKIADKNIKQSTLNSKPSLCLDTCVFIHMFKIANQPKTPYPTEIKIQTKKFLNLIKKNKINLYIPLFVFYEIVNFSNRENSKLEMLNFIYSLNIKIINTNSIKMQVGLLANSYSNKLTAQNIMDYIYMFNENVSKSYYNNPIFYRKPNGCLINDSYIMATSAIAGIPLVTENTHDFVWNDKQKFIATKNKAENLSIYAIPLTTKQAIEFVNSRIEFPKINAQIKFKKYKNAQDLLK